MNPPCHMLDEALSAPDIVRHLLAAGPGPGEDALVRRLLQRPPPFAMTLARGSSDHAAAFARYLFETRLGLVTAIAAPSVVTLYHARPRVADALVLAVSQSGESPDLLQVAEQARCGGAVTAALLNVADSPLASRVDHVLPLGAGPEHSVAATKTVIATLASLARLTARWSGDDGLLAALAALPDRLEEAARCEWDRAMPILAPARDLLVVARGPTLPVAREMALKFKEAAAMHAEPFSSAELRHGPMALVERGYPVLVIATDDAARDGVLRTARAVKDAGAHLILAATDADALSLADTPLPLPAPLHPALDPIVALQAFYPFMARLARHRGADPDRPRHLRKVTRTV